MNGVRLGMACAEGGAVRICPETRMRLSGDMPWYYANSGDRQGPVSDEEFFQLIANGRVRDDTLVWKQGMPDWRRYSELAPSLAVPPALPAAANLSPGESRTASTVVSTPEFIRACGVAGRQYAGFWIRFVAVVIDGIILGIGGQLVGSLVQATLFPDGLRRLAELRDHPESADPGSVVFIFQMMAVMLLVTTLLGIAYDIFFLRRYAATPGKLAVGIRIERADGSPLSVGRIIGRYFGRMLSSLLLFVGYLIAAFDDEKRALHDFICDTRVVKRG